MSLQLNVTLTYVPLFLTTKTEFTQIVHILEFFFLELSSNSLGKKKKKKDHYKIDWVSFVTS